MSELCACGKPAMALGMCKTHYQRAWRAKHMPAVRAAGRHYSKKYSHEATATNACARIILLAAFQIEAYDYAHYILWLRAGQKCGRVTP